VTTDSPCRGLAPAWRWSPGTRRSAYGVPPALNARWTSLEHRELRSLQCGTPRTGTPELVLVPGLGALGYLLPLVRACAAWTRVHLLDVPGFGDARTASSPASLDAVGRDVAAWLDAAHRRPVVLAGHSTGAQAAVRAALLCPGRVSSLVLGSPTFPRAARTWRGLAVRVLRTVPHEPLGLVGATAPQYLRGRGGVLTLLRTAMDDTPEDHIAALRCRVTVVRGARDAVCPPEWAAALAGRARNGRCVTVPGAHNFPYTDPGPAARAVREASAM
jgi:pimeloyl-ACP methyl ester carboxylesterase